MAIKLITDSSCDLSLEFIKENNIEVLPLILNIDGISVNDDFGQTISYTDFYNRLRNGSTPSTAQINAYTFEEAFKGHVDAGDEVLYIGISSNLSGTLNSANIAIENIIEENPKAKIYAMDSKSVSLGLGLLINKVSEQIKDGKELEDIVNWIENNREKVVHAILVEDLNHLKRGGRISGTTAAIGGLLNIKPTLKLDNEGRLVPSDKIKGKKKALKHLVNIVKERAINPEEEVLYIVHGDVLEEAETLRDMILEEVKFKKVVINYMGVVVGAHGGPGILATVFLGTER